MNAHKVCIIVMSWNGAVGWATGFLKLKFHSSIDMDILHLHKYLCTSNDLFSHMCKNTHIHTHLMLIIPHNTKVNYLNLLTCSDHHSPAEPEQDFCWGIRLCYHCLAHPRFSWGSQVAKSNTSYIRDHHSWCIFFLNIVSDIRIKM